MESKRRRSFFGWQRQWVTAITIVVVLLLAGGGTVAAASNSMPDSALYPVKLATEQVQLMLIPSDIGKARLCAQLADRRVAEIIYMADKGTAQQIEVITQRLDKHLVMLVTLASVPKQGGLLRSLAPSEEATADRDEFAGTDSQAKLRATLARYAVNHPVALHRALEKSPESVKPALRQAIAVSITGYERALIALD